MDWDWLTDWLSGAFGWLVDLLLWVPLKLYTLLLAGLATVFEAIPLPSWASGLSFAGIHPAIAYFGAPMQFDLGLTCIVGGTLLRFLIRRIPVIG